MIISYYFHVAYTFCIREGFANKMIPNHILQVIFEFEIFCKFGFYRTCHIWHISFTAVMQQTSQLYMVGKSSCFSLFAARDRMLGNRIKETGMTVCTTDQRQGMSDVFHINFFRNRMDGVEMLPRKSFCKSSNFLQSCLLSLYPNSKEITIAWKGL